MLTMFCAYCRKMQAAFKFNKDLLRELSEGATWCNLCKRREQALQASRKQFKSTVFKREGVPTMQSSDGSATPEQKMTTKRDDLLREFFS